MPMNRKEFANVVCRELELLPAGQTIEPDFKIVIDTEYDTRWALLANKGLAYFPKNEIPDAMVGPLSVYIAGYAAGKLLDTQGKIEKMSRVEDAMRDMRKVAGKKKSSGTVNSGTYF